MQSTNNQQVQIIKYMIHLMKQVMIYQMLNEKFVNYHTSTNTSTNTNMYTSSTLTQTNNPTPTPTLSVKWMFSEWK